MGDTSIEWTERSWNPIVGCTVVSPGCTNCYAMGMADRFKGVYRGRKWAGAPAEAMTRRVNGKAVWTGQLTLAPDRILTEPLRRRKPTTYFVNSMGDLFHEDTPEAWIDRVVAVMALCPQHTFQVLTKRAERMRAYMDAAKEGVVAALRSMEGAPARKSSVSRASQEEIIKWNAAAARFNLERGYRNPPWPLPNVWLGVSAEDQKRADERVPDLLATQAAIRFVSAEPLLGPINFGRLTDLCAEAHYHSDALAGVHTVGGKSGDDFTAPCAKLDWIIVGGESGPGARPMHPDWPRQIRDQCAAAGTAFFFKQWGEWGFDPATLDAGGPSFHRFPDGAIVQHYGKKSAGRLLDGAEHNAMPEARR
jgi:protein gp37